MNDIVIPLTKSRTDFLDLRYALRSIEKNVLNYNEIVIVGEKPSWIQGVIHIPHSDVSDVRFKERNILRKIYASCIKSNLTENILFSNDDIFLLKEMDASDYPYYYKGTCEESVLSNKSTYKITMKRTMRLLKDRNFPDMNYDAHCPIIYNRRTFLNTFDQVDFETPYGYGIKTLYSSFNRVKGVPVEDLKISRKITKEEVEEKCKDRQFVSCSDAALKTGLGEYLNELFPKKSTYEKK